MSNGISAEKVVKQYYGDVYKFCCSRCRDSRIAEDITQETFLVLMQRKDELTDQNICAWLINVANNKLHEWYRQKTLETSHISLEDLFVPPSDAFAEIDDEEEVDEDKALDAVQQKILNLLNDKEKELFIKIGRAHV